MKVSAAAAKYCATHQDDTNTAITSGLFIEGKHMNVRKLLTEPKRCLKCQKYSHYANNCKATADTCAQCGEQHHTAQCPVTDMATFQCTNCTDAEAIRHGAADRECPVFLAQCHKIQERIPKNKYKFFPTSSPTTWKLLNKPDPHTELNQPRH